jgi:GST-like protein
MIDLYTFATPNGHKASIALEELELPYRVHVVDISKGDQFKPEFLAVNPNSKIPAIVDHDAPGGAPLSIFESGAILIYLAEKTGRFLPTDPGQRAHTLQWLMFQMGGVGPMFGQMNHFTRFAPEKVPYGIERYTKESKRLLGVLDRALEGREGLAGPYTIADMATYPWIAGTAKLTPELLNGHAHVQAWLDRVGARPAVQRGMKVPDLSR